ncbi:MAG: PRD domain-containing protein [Bacillota bacterium]|uniref:PRD domain-containing protein n=1 Tax=Virgibacillus salarius TaxID=447199 RepID=A0A941DU00_9BACI|nr:MULTISPECIES: PRD domain-containing protein [Bacillaceae]NAZ07821.1 PRD domain-containing protein [Agaribacter marinus]MBR7795104.1 PRD domain-containing protein [Virgibacillus salarius]MCC2248392.1 PRD domain-containing protein [Virgibacillus sp. AGTR]MDY7045455.1 PRD domain-containing protein [Virgibacillus sp. M23]QRZ16745.1 PRD domain-containing protein [Virgibacillus sp. AGTR]
MNVAELEDRLHILVLGEVITKEACHITLAAFQELVNELELEEVDQAEMLFTHLPSALTRIERGEALEAPSPAIMEEVKQSAYYLDAERHVNKVQQSWEKELPQEEKEFLYMHYTNVLAMNKGGNKK